MNEGLDNEMMEDTGVADVSNTAHESMDAIGLEEGLTQMVEKELDNEMVNIGEELTHLVDKGIALELEENMGDLNGDNDEHGIMETVDLDTGLSQSVAEGHGAGMQGPKPSADAPDAANECAADVSDARAEKGM